MNESITGVKRGSGARERLFERMRTFSWSLKLLDRWPAAARAQKLENPRKRVKTNTSLTPPPLPGRRLPDQRLDFVPIEPAIIGARRV